MKTQYVAIITLWGFNHYLITFGVYNDIMLPLENYKMVVKKITNVVSNKL